MNVEDALTGHGSLLSKNWLTLLFYPAGQSNYIFHKDPYHDYNIDCIEQPGSITINISQSSDDFILRVKRSAPPVDVSFIDPAGPLTPKNSFAEFELGHQVDEPRFESTHVPADFVDDARDAAHQGVGGLVANLQGALAQAFEAAWIVAAGEGIVIIQPGF